MRQRSRLASAILAAATCLQPLTAGACGDGNRNVVDTMDDLRSMSLFAVAAETDDGSDVARDAAGRPLQFIGNAFLIEKVEERLDAIAFFATARHNVTAACKRVAEGEAPRIRLVTMARGSYAVDNISAARCAELRATAAHAGAVDVLHVPDVEILRAHLPAGVGKPVMVGSQSAGVAAANGTVEQMSKSFLPLSKASVGLPVTPWQNPKHREFNNLLAIDGSNLAGASGSPFVVFDGRKPVVLGIVTHSIPPTGTMLRVGDEIYDAEQTQRLIVLQFPALVAQSYSLVFKPESLLETYDQVPVDDRLSSRFSSARAQAFGDPVRLADDLAGQIAKSGLSAAIYIRRQCEQRPESFEDRVALAFFCMEVIRRSVDSQCFVGSASYAAQITDWMRRLPDKSVPHIATAAANIRIVNDARTLIGQIAQDDGATEIAGVVKDVLSVAIDALAETGVQRSQEWKSKVLFDLALAERKAGNDDDVYLSRLRDAIDTDPSNINARKAFVDATVQAGSSENAERSIALLSGLRAERAIPALEADRTLTLLRQIE